MNTLQGLDAKYHASDRAKATDETYGISARTNTFLSGLGSYFEQATNTPTGQKIIQFYTDGQKQVQEVHAEARRLAELKKDESGGSAYKASGMEKIFGKEKAASSGEKPFDAAAAAAQSSTEGVPTGTMAPTPAVATEPLPGVESKSEKYA